MKNNKCVTNASISSPTTKTRASDNNKSVLKLPCKLKPELKPGCKRPCSVVQAGTSNITVKTHIKRSPASSAIPKHFHCCQRPQTLQQPQILQRPQTLQQPQLLQCPKFLQHLQALQHLRPKVRFAQVLLRSQRPVVLSQEDLRQLTSRFEALTATVVRVARSPCPLSVRSLESLLAKEVSECLGHTVNSTKFAEAFVRETRRLLDGLNREFDEGKVKVNPQLVKGAPQPSPKNTSLTDHCYRERYLQQLVLNVLLDMCSEAGSKQWLVKGLMRADVLEPATVQKMEREVQQLQRSASRSILRVQQASREVDRLISHHLITKEGSEKADSSKKMSDKDTTNNVDAGIINEVIQSNVKNYSLKHSAPKNCDVSVNTSSKGVEDNHSNVQSLEKKDSKNLALNPFQSVRPKMDEIVRRELCIARNKTQTLISQIDGGSLQASHSRLMENMSSDIPMADDETDNEINSEETFLFLKVFQADETHQRVSTSESYSVCPKLESSKHDNEMDPNFQTDGFSCPVSNKGRESSIFGNDGQLGSLQEHPLYGSHTNKIKPMPTYPEDMRGICYYDKTLNEKELHVVKSDWWNSFDEEKESREIVNKMKRALDTFQGCPIETFVKNKITHRSPKNYERPDKDIDVKHYDITVEEMAEILNNVSKTVYHLPIGGGKRSLTTTFPISYSQQTQLARILSEIGNALDDSCLSEEYSLHTSNEEEIINKELEKKWKIALTFKKISEHLNRVPSQLKKQPISELKPPDSLMRTLALLASYTYFRDCFICGIMKVRRSKDALNVKLDAENKISEHVINLSSKNKNMDLFKIPDDDIEIVKPIGLKEESSSKIVSVSSISEGTSVSLEDKQNLALRRLQLMKTSHSEDVHENTRKYEHYVGLSTAVMTVQNVSDMFVFLSTVLNSIPDRVKSQKLHSLDPPPSLLSALDILYDAEDGGCFTDVQRTSSLNSLSVQSVSDLFLTLSKTFEDLPERVKRSNILDLSPPRSLLRAVNLLTSLPFNSVLDDGCRTESQDSFYDALEESAGQGSGCLPREDLQT